jgi:hypothetical protein
MGVAVNLPPRSLGALLVEVGVAGVELSSHPSAPDRIRHKPPELPAHFAARISFYKPDVLRLLQSGFTPTDAEAAYVHGERLGIAEDLGMPTAPGSPGWLVAVGEAIETAWKEAQNEAGNRP